MSEQCVRILARKMDMSLFPVDDCYCVRSHNESREDAIIVIA